VAILIARKAEIVATAGTEDSGSMRLNEPMEIAASNVAFWGRAPSGIPDDDWNHPARIRCDGEEERGFPAA